MNQTCARLNGVLDNLISSHRALLELEQEKQQLIVDQNWDLLQQRVERSREVLEEIEVKEASRRELVGNIGMDPDSRLSDVLGSVPEQFRDELSSRGGRLMELIGRLRDLNQQSARLLGSSLEVIDFTLSLISGSERQGRTYGGNGRERRAEGRRTSLVFDYKV